jgi:hypothetical protein
MQICCQKSISGSEIIKNYLKSELLKKTLGRLDTVLCHNRPVRKIMIEGGLCRESERAIDAEMARCTRHPCHEAQVGPMVGTWSGSKLEGDSDAATALGVL